MLIRAFVKMGAHHRAEEFEVGKEPVDDELHIHTWMNASLREISDLLKETHPAARERGGRLSFAIVYPDKVRETREGGRFVHPRLTRAWPPECASPEHASLSP